MTLILNQRSTKEMRGIIGFNLFIKNPMKIAVAKSGGLLTGLAVKHR